MQIRDLFEGFPLRNDDVYPMALQQLLREEIDVYRDAERAEKLLLDARYLLPDRLELPTALYKLYAYSYRCDEALALIHEVLERSAHCAGFPADWRRLTPHCAPWRQAEGMTRVYLYTLKALGFVLLRKGELAGAHAALSKLMQLDPLDQVGGSVVLGMAERLREEEDDDRVAVNTR